MFIYRTTPFFCGSSSTPCYLTTFIYCGVADVEFTAMNSHTEEPKDGLGNTISQSDTSNFLSQTQSSTISQKNKDIIHNKTESISNNISINALPDEILVQIFSQLDPLLLNGLKLVCKKWNHVINDKDTWMRLFQIRFGINTNMSSFPSVTNGTNWMNEYFARLAVVRNWRKGHAIHQTYQILNNEHRFNDETLCDFKMNKICIFDKKLGNICSGNLNSGRNQSFIPGAFTVDTLSFGMNWNYVVIGKINGDLVLRNMASSTSYTQRVSLTKFEVDEHSKSPIMCVEINNHVDKYGASTDIISGSYKGVLQAWTIHGKKVGDIQLDGTILNIKSDFNKFIVTNTESHIYVVDFKSFKVLNKIRVYLDFGEDVLHLEQLLNLKNELDVDFGGKNIIFSYKSKISVFGFEGSGSRTLKLNDGVEVVKSQFQTCLKNRLTNVNTHIAGHDGLLYANLLSDDSIIVWNVREYSTSTIVPQLQLFPSFDYKRVMAGLNNMISRFDLMSINSFALTGSVLAVSGYNGLTNIYDVFTGKLLKEASIKFPKRYEHLHNSLRTTNYVKLNPNPLDSNGVIVCGDTIQYFQFGDLESASNSRSNSASGNKKPKLVNTGLHGKNANKKRIKDGYDEFQRQVYTAKETEKMFDKYNGTEFESEEDELRMGLVLSENMSSNECGYGGGNGGGGYGVGLTEQEEEDLRLAMEISKLEDGTVGTNASASASASGSASANISEEEIDEELEAALKLSMVEF